tara:strand:+ start:45 stop:407 length:363 start_codon:yes stop_codon:yes gene_type:complete
MVKINGKEYTLKSDVYTLVQFCKRINEESITVAMAKLSKMGGPDGIRVDGVENWAAILFEMLKRGAQKTGVELDLTIEDCYETITDVELIEEAVAIIAASLPAPETMRKSKRSGKMKAAV